MDKLKNTVNGSGIDFSAGAGSVFFGEEKDISAGAGSLLDGVKIHVDSTESEIMDLDSSTNETSVIDNLVNLATSSLRDDITQPIFYDYLSQIEKYGGNQEGLWNNRKKYFDDEIVKNIINKYYPDVSKEDMELLFYRIRTTGCGYTSAVTNLMNYYYDKQDEFKQNFGIDYGSYYSMQGVNGFIPNYDYLLLDYYLYYQKNYEKFETIKDVYGNAMDEMLNNISPDLLEKTFEREGAIGAAFVAEGTVFQNYLKDHGVNCRIIDEQKEEIDKRLEWIQKFGNEQEEIDDYDFIKKIKTLDSNMNQEIGYDVLRVIERSRDYYASIDSDDYTLYYNYDVDGNGKLDDIAYDSNWPHAMTFVKTTDDPEMIVISSYGQEYIMNIHDIKDYIIYDFGGNNG